MFVRTTTINKILKLKKRIKAIQGGTSSGKTFGIIPILIDKALKNPGLEISIVSESVPHLKRGVIKDFKKIMIATKRWNRPQWHGSDSKYTFMNDSTIEFFSADNDSKLRGARRDVLYINECNNIKFEAYQELQVRTKKEIYLDWNPTAPFWYQDRIEGDKDVNFIIVTYKDNEACPQSAIDEIHKAKEKAFHKPNQKQPFTDKNIKNKYWANWYRVYGLGQLGTLQGVIFENWTKGEFDHSLPYGFGLDFGFADPLALIRVAVNEKEKKIYLKEEIYETKLNTEVLTDRIKRICDKRMIIADSANKLTINDLIRAGLTVRPSKKPEIIERIRMAQSYDIIVDPNSLNLIKEFQNYIWAEKNYKPIDDFNHGHDAWMYYLVYHAKSSNFFVN